MGIRTGRRKPSSHILKKAVFLDRDGTIVRHVELLHRARELRLFPGAARAIKKINKLGYLAIVVTNQPVVARGIIGQKEVDRIHAALIGRLKRSGAKIDAVYYCPHHPDGNVKKYRMKCRCRKPEIGMIIKAAKEYGVDLKKSFIVGDSTRDIQAGNRAKIKTILVETGHGGKDRWQFKSKPDFIAKDLSEAVNVIRKISVGRKKGLRRVP